MELSRRALLATAGVGGVAGIAGCLDFAAGEGPQGPEGEPDELTCDDDSFRRLDQPFEEDAVQYVSAWVDDVRFELAAEGSVESYGSELRFVLRNLGDVDVSIGAADLVSVQRQTGAGWQDVRGTPDGSDVSYPGDTVTVGPGDGHSWSLTLREAAISDTLSTTDLEVCPPLGTGTHRFVFWGLPGEAAIGRQFDIVG